MVKIKKIRLSSQYGTSQYVGDWIFSYGFYNHSLYSFSSITGISRISCEIIHGKEREIWGDSIYRYNYRFL